MNNDITLILNGLVYGFCFTTLICYLLSLFKSQKLKRFNNSFFSYSIKVIRIIAIIYFFYYVVDLTNYYFIKDHTLFSKRATGPYWLAYWIMLLRPFLFCLLIQLLWLRKLQRRSFWNFILVFIIFFAVLASGANIERYIIMVTSFHREYPFESNALDSIHWFPIILFGIIQRILMFSVLVLVIRFLHKKLKNKA